MRKEIIWAKDPPAPELNKDEARALYCRAFDVINRTLFNGDLPPIDIRKGERNDGASGVFHVIIETQDDKPEEAPQIIEIYIEMDTDAAEVYGISTDTINILFHEMIHYYCFLHGISDTDNGGDYHNMQFKQAVEAHGGKCRYLDAKSGYTDTELPQSTAIAIFDQI